jgi:demethylmenaquinone methyltransferase/2-methoxy-6-polyprenyl-1,4-benzoquinol methylase
MTVALCRVSMVGASDVSTFDRFARIYDLFMPGADAVKLDGALERADRPVDRLLDVGGGTGRAAQALDADQRIVLDAARGMLMRAHDRGLATIQGDAARLPLVAAAVDAVTIVDALHHVHGWDRLFEEVFRVLRPGGVVAISDFDPTTLLGRALVVGEHLIGFESQFVSPQGLCDRLETVGFETVVVDDGFGYTVAGVIPKRENKSHSTQRQ